VINALETGKPLQTAMEGSQAESQELEKVLYENDFYEKPESKLAKQEAFEFLKVIIEAWSLNIAKTEKRISKEEMNNYVARVLVFGSYVLELNSNDSDVDVICVVPNFINR
jgi:poly(A) polymerase Pap1